jgi:hypothetical protein
MKTKEEIYAEAFVNDADPSYVIQSKEDTDKFIKTLLENKQTFRFTRAAFSAMESYAKEIAIAFADWLDTSVDVFSSNEELFNQFIQSHEK